jgi:hypothetical protein
MSVRIYIFILRNKGYSLGAASAFMRCFFAYINGFFSLYRSLAIFKADILFSFI